MKKNYSYDNVMETIKPKIIIYDNNWESGYANDPVWEEFQNYTRSFIINKCVQVIEIKDKYFGTVKIYYVR